MNLRQCIQLEIIPIEQKVGGKQITSFPNYRLSITIGKYHISLLRDGRLFFDTERMINEFEQMLKRAIETKGKELNNMVVIPIA